jgi:phosphoserine phosphatase RsbU/P
MTFETQPYEIRCAEIWGGAAATQDEVQTPGVRAVIHSSASGADRGGDLYYFSVCAYDTLTRIAIGDVRGHGLTASHLSEWLYTALEARMNDSNGAGVLQDLNEIVRRRGFEAITTAAIATFHRGEGVLYYAYAGHPPLMLGRPGHPWRELPMPATPAPANLPLGVMQGARFVQEKVPVAPGDRLFLYTDGVSECPAAAGSSEPDLFGDTKMCEALRQSTTYPLHEVRQGIRDQLMEHAGGQLTHDDCTFMFVEVLERTPFWQRRILPGRRRAPLSGGVRSIAFRNQIPGVE